MRFFLSLIILGFAVSSVMADDAPHDPLMVKALAKLETRLNVKFVIPFPADLDVDAYMKQPMALLPVEGGKVCATHPILNPFDEPLLLEWMIGPADPAALGRDGLSCRLDFDPQGEIVRTGLIADWAADGNGNHQLERRDHETGPEFFRRALETYRLRSQKAKDPAQADLFLKAFGKISLALHSLRQDESRATPE